MHVCIGLAFFANKITLIDEYQNEGNINMI